MLKSSPMHNSGEATKLSHLVQPAEGTICQGGVVLENYLFERSDFL